MDSQRNAAWSQPAPWILTIAALSATASSAAAMGPNSFHLERCSGLRGLCSGGIAATVTPAQLQAWHAATIPQAALPEGNDPCRLPSATCHTPQPGRLQLTAHGVTGEERTSGVETAVYEASTASDIGTWLTRWEAASRSRSPLSSRDEIWLQRMNSATLCAHALETVKAFLGPMTAAVQDNFDWELAAVNDTAVTLLATPHDEALRLFCPQVRLALSTAHLTCQTIAVRDRSGEWHDVACPILSEPTTPPLTGKEPRGIAVDWKDLEGDAAHDELPPRPLPILAPAAALIRVAAEPSDVIEIR